MNATFRVLRTETCLWKWATDKLRYCSCGRVAGDKAKPNPVAAETYASEDANWSVSREARTGLYDSALLFCTTSHTSPAGYCAFQ